MPSNWGKYPTYAMTKKANEKITALVLNCTQKKPPVFSERAT
jgi:hypothetical protein